MKASPLFLALGLVAGPSAAADLVVTRTDDPVPDVVDPRDCRAGGDCSLREAVLAANRLAGADRIVLGRGVHELQRTTVGAGTTDGRSGPLLVTEALEVVGVSSRLTRIRWSASVSPPRVPVAHKHPVWLAIGDFAFALQDLAVSGGRGETGGCIQRSRGDLALRRTVVERCIGQSGGAINLFTLAATDIAGSSVLELTDTILRDNQADQGGALFLRSTVIVSADGAQLLANTASLDGGGVYIAPTDALVPAVPFVTWHSEGAGAVVADNVAGGEGGGFALFGSGYADLSSPDGTATMVVERNTAAGSGGGISRRNFFNSTSTGPETTLTLERVRLRDNTAAQGGGLALRYVRTQIRDSAFERNAAVAGSGGAIAHSPVEIGQQTHVAIQRSTFNQNRATGLGGAIFSDCQIVSATSTSFYANTSTGQGEAISSSGTTWLVHVTTDGHGQPGSGPSTLHKAFHTACGGEWFKVNNSIIGGLDTCRSQSGVLTSGGGNQVNASASGCPFVAGNDAWGSAATFALSLGTFGGELQVLGWPADGTARPQVDFARAPYCSPTDIRGLPRSVGVCDAGAFEQQ